MFLPRLGEPPARASVTKHCEPQNTLYAILRNDHTIVLGTKEGIKALSLFVSSGSFTRTGNLRQPPQTPYFEDERETDTDTDTSPLYGPEYDDEGEATDPTDSHRTLHHAPHQATQLPFIFCIYPIRSFDTKCCSILVNFIQFLLSYSVIRASWMLGCPGTTEA